MSQRKRSPAKAKSSKIEASKPKNPPKPASRPRRVLMASMPILNPQAARKRFEAGKGIPHEEFWKEAERRQASTQSKRERVKTL